jgi:PmbA protein
MSVSPKKVAELALRSAKRAGAPDADAYVFTDRELSVEVRDGRVQSVKQADTRGLRVFTGQRTALVYTSDFRERALDDLAERAMVLAKSAVPDEANVLAEPARDEAALPELYDEAVAAIGPDELIARVVDAEKAATSADARVTATQYAGGSRGDSMLCIANSRGVRWHYPSTYVVVFLGVLADDADGKQRSGGDASVRRFLADLRPSEEIGREAARRAVRMIGAKKIPTEKLPVVMHRDVAGAWMGNLFEAFSGEQVFKKASYLGERLGEAIASPLVTLVDDPTRPRVMGGAPCDDEGTPTRRVVLLDKGVVRSFVYDLRWAKKAGARSTGHGTRGYTSVPGIGPHSLYLENGVTPVEEMIRGLDRGFYLTETGAFGYDAATGGWSYQASGLLIEKGELTTPVTDVSLASDTLTMLKGIRQVGNDLQEDGSVNAPHLLIGEMALSGT